MPHDKFFMFRQQNSNLNEKYKLKTKKLAATVKNLVFVSIFNKTYRTSLLPPQESKI